MSDFKFKVKDNFDYVLDESSNMSTNLRKIAWGDSDIFKLDIRKWYYKDGEERMSKGISLSDNAANELVPVLCENGYGDTRRILDSIKDRSEFKQALNDSLNNAPIAKYNDNGEEESYYDPSELLGA